MTYDIHAKRYIDPSDQVLIQHIKAIHHLIQVWPQDQLQALEQAWQQTYHRLQEQQYPWYTVRGPLAATIAYLLEWGWQPSELLHWARPKSKLLLANELHLQQPWWQLERTLNRKPNGNGHPGWPANSTTKTCSLDWTGIPTAKCASNRNSNSTTTVDHQPRGRTLMGAWLDSSGAARSSHEGAPCPRTWMLGWPADHPSPTT